MKEIRLGIIANIGKPAIAEVLTSFLAWLESESIAFIIAEDLKSIISNENYNSVKAEDVAEDVDFVLSFGGDGTFLHTAHLIEPRQTPIIGVNLGAFGYLAEVRVEQLQQRITDLRREKFRVQKRVMLKAQAGAEPGKHVFYGLNDIVIEKGEFPRTIRLETTVDGEYLNTFNADGLIVSTPTGSTGYSLSVGGPIIEPDVDVMIINPVNPHTLANRPLVVSGDRSIAISTFSEAGEFQVVADGQRMLRLKSGEKVVIERAPFTTHLVIFGDNTFYSLLRNKLRWRAQLNDNSASGEPGGDK